MQKKWSLIENFKNKEVLIECELYKLKKKVQNLTIFEKYFLLER